MKEDKNRDGQKFPKAAPLIPVGHTRMERLKAVAGKLGLRKEADRPPPPDSKKPEAHEKPPAPPPLKIKEKQEAPPPLKVKGARKVSIVRDESPPAARTNFRTIMMTTIMPKFALKKCPKCRSRMSDDGVFCVRCGYDIITRKFVNGVPSRPLAVLRTEAVLSTIWLLVRLPFLTALAAGIYLTQGMSAVKKMAVSTLLILTAAGALAIVVYAVYEGFVAGPDYVVDSGGAHITDRWRDAIKDSASWTRYFEKMRAAGKSRPYVKFQIGFHAEKDEFNLMDARKTYLFKVIDLETGGMVFSETVDVGGQTVLKEGETRQTTLIKNSVERAAAKALSLKGFSGQ